MEKDAIWRTVLKCKYGVTMGEGGGVWKKGEEGTAFFYGSIFAWGGTVLPAMTFSVGHGTNVCSWLDLWCGDILKDAFLDLYGISWDKGATLADHLCWRDGSMLWDVIFMWLIHNWEVEALTTFIDLIYSTKIRRDVVDKIFWQHTKSGLFEVKPFYRNLYTVEGVFFPRRVFGRLKSHLR